MRVKCEYECEGEDEVEVISVRVNEMWIPFTYYDYRLNICYFKSSERLKCVRRHKC